MNLKWESYEPYDNFPRQGWKTKIGKLVICVHEEYRLLSNGSKKWIGHVEGCKASIRLLGWKSIVSADMAMTHAEKEIREIIEGLNGCHG